MRNTVIICTCTGLYRKWLNDDTLTGERVQSAAEAAADYFDSVDISAELEPKRDYWIDCPHLRPYLFLATTEYEGYEEAIQQGADTLVRHLNAGR